MRIIAAANSRKNATAPKHQRHAISASKIACSRRTARKPWVSGLAGLVIEVGDSVWPHPAERGTTAHRNLWHRACPELAEGHSCLCKVSSWRKQAPAGVPVPHKLQRTTMFT